MNLGEWHMANQNRGGGFLLWGITWASSKLRNRKIRKFNTQARGVKQLSGITVDYLFPPNSYRDNIVISGGSSGDRVRFCEKILQDACTQKRAVIVLTSGNFGLANTIYQGGLGTVVNNQNKVFDAFMFLELQDICRVVFDTDSQKYNIQPSGRYILQIVHEILQAQNLKPYFSNFANFDYHKISASINQCLLGGLINQIKANDLNSFLAMGQSEISKIDSFFYDAKIQFAGISSPNPNSTGAMSALSAIWNNQICLIDVGGVHNSFLFDLIINSLFVANEKGLEYTLLIDDIPASSPALQSILQSKSNNNNIICTNDAFVMLGGSERNFSNMVGVADKTVLLSHGSHISCEMWSKYIGQYEKIDTSRSSGGGWLQSSRWGYMNKQSQTEAMKREHKIKPEEIADLGQNQVIVYENRGSELYKANMQ